MPCSSAPTSSSDPPPPFAVEALTIHKSFAGVPALRGCDLRVRSGHFHALLGQNGAGKSTLVKILNGVHPAGSFEGEIRLAGRPISFESPAQARQGGVGYVPQEIEVIEDLSVGENILAGRIGLGRGFLVRWKEVMREATAILAELGLQFDPNAPVSLLTAAQRHLVMIARALAVRPALLILDEPTASLSEPEIERLFSVLRSLRERGMTMIYITHRLAEVLAICDRASVLRDGVVAAEFDRGDFGVDELVSAMSGRRLANQFPPRHRNVRNTPLLTIDRLSVTINGRPRVREASFDLKAGEILGIAGVMGAGRTELLAAICGSQSHEGRIFIENRECPIASPADARRAGISMMTEDRRRDGLFFNLSVAENITAGNLRLFARAGLIDRARESLGVSQRIAALNLTAHSLGDTVAHLSGGNQQKLLFARVLMAKPKVLLLDEPTKGVDVATRLEIYRLIVGLAEAGVGLIVVSSELEEVLGLADRCLVMAEGRIIDEFPGAEGTEARILHSIANAQTRS